jgi:hypothetical protein
MSPWWLLLIIPGVVCVTLYFIGMLHLGGESDAYLRGYHDGMETMKNKMMRRWKK